MGDMADIEEQREMAMEAEAEMADQELDERMRDEARRSITEAFDPVEKITAIKGQAYLEVKWRLAWFRAEHPEGRVDTQMVNVWGMDTENPFVVFKATVSTGDGGIAVGHKTEEKDHFDDFMEKAETGAIGRALAALGYGTQFATELDEGTVADAPIKTQRSYPPSGQQARPMGGSQAPRSGGGGGKPSDKQWDSFNSIVDKSGINAIQLVKDVAGVNHPNDLTGGRDGSMSKVLDILFAIRRNERTVEPQWRLDDTPDGPPQQQRHNQAPRQAPRAAASSGGDAKANFEAQIKKARTSMQLDAIFKGMQAAGLDQDADLLGLMSDVEVEIEARQQAG